MNFGLDIGTLSAAVLLIGALAFLLGLALDGIMARGGYGPVGNTLIIAAGCVLGLVIAQRSGILRGDLTMASATGLAGAFLALGALALLKTYLTRH